MPFLLSPAGTKDAFTAAVQNGADEIYLGLPKFNARASADNFTLEDLAEYVKYAHVRGVKVHVTLNTLLTDDEMESAVDLAKEADRIGVDAFIIQDLGLLTKLSGNVKAALHASTQMTICSEDSMKLLKDFGVSRAVLARELNIKEIEHLSNLGIMETEVFCHGALCVSYSGECLLSSFTTGRSGNRGTCSQPCRLKYKCNGDNRFLHLLSPADLCSLSYLDKLTKAGVTSLKIEGRLKSPEYVAAVTKAYRTVLDNPGISTDELIKELTVVFSRGGFCSGHQLSKLQTKNITYNYAGRTGLDCGKIFSVKKEKKNGVSLFTADAVLTEKLSVGDGITFKGFEQKGGIVNIISVNGKRSQSACKADGRISITVCGDAPFIEKGSSAEFYKTLDAEKDKQLKASYTDGKEHKIIKINGNFSGKTGKFAEFTACDHDNHRVVVKSEAILESGVTPSPDDIRKNLSSTGGTIYEFESITVSVEDGSFIPFSTLKKMRREALSVLTQLRGGDNR